MQRVAWSWTVWQTFHSYILQQPYHKQHKRTLTAVWLHRAAYETREYGSTKGMRGNVATPKIWLRQTGSNPPSLLLRTWWTCNTTIKGTFPNKKCWEIWDNSSLKFQLQNWFEKLTLYCQTGETRGSAIMEFHKNTWALMFFFQSIDKLGLMEDIDI